MPAVVVVHDDARFIDEAVAALTSAGIDAIGLTDPLLALNAVTVDQGIRVLVTGIKFPPGKQHGISLALMARMKRPDLKVIFAARSEYAVHAEGIGDLMALPVPMPDLVRRVAALLDRLLPRVRYRRRKTL